MKKTIFLIFLSFTSLVLLAQTVQLKGTVKDAKTGELLIGVNIIVEGSQTGTVTDLDGNFVISAPADGTLKISYIGYKTQQVKFSGQKMLDIQLESDSKTIDEIVVVGYSVQKKRDVLGAISKVGSNELSKIPVASAQQALQGRIAGVKDRKSVV